MDERGRRICSTRGSLGCFHTRKWPQIHWEKKPLDFCFYQSGAGGQNFDYGKVVVAGELKGRYVKSDFEQTFSQLTRYMLEIFWEQPNRRFVHGFTLEGRHLELWVYDRSGAYSSGRFNVTNKNRRGILADALATYATMTEEEAGYESAIQLDGKIATLVHESLTTLLCDRFFRVKSIVSRGTVCYSTTYDGVPAALKMSWLMDPPDNEVRLLEEAADVEKVGSLKKSITICDTEQLRSGLHFLNTRYEFRARRNDHPGYNRASGVSQPYHRRTLVCLVIAPLGVPLAEFRTLDELCKAMLGSIMAHKSLFLDKRILHRDISPGNLLILRRDDGVDGCLIDLDHATKLDNGQTPSATIASTNPPRAGTKMYMAVEVLRGIDHTYRHDLESFYYVLLHMCFMRSRHLFKHSGDQESADKASSIKFLLSEWRFGSFKEASDQKDKWGMKPFLESRFSLFHPEVEPLKDLCEQIREALFLESGMFLGTPGNPRHLYDKIIQSFRDHPKSEPTQE